MGDISPLHQIIPQGNIPDISPLNNSDMGMAELANEKLKKNKQPFLPCDDVQHAKQLYTIVTAYKTRAQPKRPPGTGEAYYPAYVNEQFRTEYYKVLDAGVQQLDDRILRSPEIERYCECDLKAILLKVKCNEEIAISYPELEGSRIVS
jgi:hypothetical protein